MQERHTSVDFNREAVYSVIGKFRILSGLTNDSKNKIDQVQTGFESWKTTVIRWHHHTTNSCRVHESQNPSQSTGVRPTKSHFNFRCSFKKYPTSQIGPLQWGLFTGGARDTKFYSLEHRQHVPKVETHETNYYRVGIEFKAAHGNCTIGYGVFDKEL